MSNSIDLEYLEIENFRSIVQHERIALDGHGLVQIRGINRDTGGSSGVGKSSINLGIAYPLDYCPFPGTELQSWLTDKPMRVALGLRTPEHALESARGASGMRLTVDGDTKKALKGKAAEAALRVHVGLTPAMLAALTYRQQRSDGTFLSKTNVEIQEFFTEVLGLSPFETAIQVSQDRAKALDVRANQAQGRLEMLGKQLVAAQDELDQAKAAYTPQDPQSAQAALLVAQEDVLKWKRLREAVSAKRSAYQGEFRQVLSSRTLAQKVVLEARSKEWMELVRIGLGKDALLREGNRLLARRHDLQKSRSVSVETCPTCNRPWDQGNAHERHLKDLEDQDLSLGEQLASVSDKLQAVKVAAEQEAALKTEVSQLQETIKSLEAEAGKEFETNLKALDAAFEKANLQLSDAENNVRVFEKRISDIERGNGLAEGLIRLRTEAHAKVLVDVQNETDAHIGVCVELAAEKDFQAMVGREGFLGAIFDEVLAEVAEETNAIMARVPNISEVTLAFRSESLTAKGKPVRAITPVVTIRGHEAPMKSGCSGGMLGAVYLAADLAVIDVVSRRLGVSPGWLVLDEVFEGLGPVEKEGYLEVLQVYAQKKLVLVVDHTTETKEYFRSHIDLVFQGGYTHIEQA